MKCFILMLLTLFSSCCNKKYIEGPQGAPGEKGDTGELGTPGSNGHNSMIAMIPAITCTNGGNTILSGLDTNDNDNLDITEVTSSVTVCNGEDAPSLPFNVVSLIDPCGTNPNIHNEVFLKLANDTIVASFSDNVNGYNTRFSVLSDGNYVTTDGDACNFTVTNGSITYEDHHF